MVIQVEGTADALHVDLDAVTPMVGEAPLLAVPHDAEVADTRSVELFAPLDAPLQDGQVRLVEVLVAYLSLPSLLHRGGAPGAPPAPKEAGTARAPASARARQSREGSSLAGRADRLKAEAAARPALSLETRSKIRKAHEIAHVCEADSAWLDSAG